MLQTSQQLQTAWGHATPSNPISLARGKPYKSQIPDPLDPTLVSRRSPVCEMVGMPLLSGGCVVIAERAPAINAERSAKETDRTLSCSAPCCNERLAATTPPSKLRVPLALPSTVALIWGFLGM